jgi:flagellar FliL protein
MAANLALPPASGQTGAKEGTKSLILTLGLLTILSALVGGGFGLAIVSSIEKRVEEKYKDLPQKPANASPYVGDIAIKKLAPVVTNLTGSESDWIRLEASIVYKGGKDVNADILGAEARQDVLGYLRTLSLAQVQGPSGLLHVREDLNERVKLRSKGEIQELVLETLVVQ